MFNQNYWNIALTFLLVYRFCNDVRDTHLPISIPLILRNESLKKLYCQCKPSGTPTQDTGSDRIPDNGIGILRRVLTCNNLTDESGYKTQQ